MTVDFFGADLFPARRALSGFQLCPKFSQALSKSTKEHRQVVESVKYPDPGTGVWNICLGWSSVVSDFHRDAPRNFWLNRSRERPKNFHFEQVSRHCYCPEAWLWRTTSKSTADLTHWVTPHEVPPQSRASRAVGQRNIQRRICVFVSSFPVSGQKQKALAPSDSALELGWPAVPGIEFNHTPKWMGLINN